MLKVLVNEMKENIEIKDIQVTKAGKKLSYFQGMSSYVWEILGNIHESYFYLITEIGEAVGHRLIYKGELLSVQK